MAIRPKRKDPLSTKPVYLPIIPTKAVEAAAGSARGVPTAETTLLLYMDSHIPGLDLEQAAKGFTAANGVKAVARGELFAIHLAALIGTERRQEGARLANELAWARIRDVSLRHHEVMPHHGDIDYELSRMRAELHPKYGDTESWASRPSGALYDSRRLQELYSEMIPRLDRTPGNEIAIFVNQFLATWRDDSGLWETVAGVQGEIGLVSLVLPSQGAELAFVYNR